MRYFHLITLEGEHITLELKDGTGDCEFYRHSFPDNNPKTWIPDFLVHANVTTPAKINTVELPDQYLLDHGWVEIFPTPSKSLRNHL